MPNKNTSLKNLKKFATFAALFFCVSVWFSSFAFAQNVVTSADNDGAGSLRQVIASAPVGSEITFDLPIGTNEITLSSQIDINKNLKIDGGSGVIISGGNSSRIFFIQNATVEMKNLTLEKGYDGGSAGGAVYVHSYSGTASFTAINCTFKNNNATFGGAVSVEGYDNGTASFTAINCTFKNNEANYGGAVSMEGSSSATAYLFHCTFDENTAATNAGDGIEIYAAAATLYAYNSIFTGSNNQIATVSGGVNNADPAKNLIQGVSANVTDRADVFYVDDLVCGGIVETAKVLKSSIVVPDHLTKTQILNWLKRDQAGKKRPKKGM